MAMHSDRPRHHDTPGMGTPAFGNMAATVPKRSEIRYFLRLSSLATGCHAKWTRSFSGPRNWPSCSSVQHERGERIMEDYPMRKTLLLTTALFAGVTLASAQSPNNRQSEGATQSKQAQEHQTPR